MVAESIVADDFIGFVITLCEASAGDILAIVFDLIILSVYFPYPDAVLILGSLLSLNKVLILLWIDLFEPLVASMLSNCGGFLPSGDISFRSAKCVLGLYALESGKESTLVFLFK